MVLEHTFPNGVSHPALQINCTLFTKCTLARNVVSTQSKYFNLISYLKALCSCIISQECLQLQELQSKDTVLENTAEEEIVVVVVDTCEGLKLNKSVQGEFAYLALVSAVSWMKRYSCFVLSQRKQPPGY